MSDELLTPILPKGWSPPIEMRGKRGRINFDAPKQKDDRTPYERYLFVTEDGNSYYQQLQKNAQGGRWEDSHHSQKDWERYLSYTPEEREQKLIDMWGYDRKDTLVPTLLAALNNKYSYEQMREVVKPYDTWRQESSGEPGIQKGIKKTTPLDSYIETILNLIKK